MTFQPLDKARFCDQVVQRISERILSGELAPGHKLPREKNLAEELAVSRSVVREALRVLERQGMVVIKKGPTGGIFVSNAWHRPLRDSLSDLVSFGQVSVENIFEVRFLLGPYIAREAARRATEDDVRELAALIDESEPLRDAEKLGRNRGRFHLRLTETLNNPVLEILMQAVIHLLREYFKNFRDLDFERRAVGIQRDILAAVADRQPDQARRIMSDYLLEVKKQVTSIQNQ
jgi:DNA-binding FadR family transcriptional regulator